VKVNEKQREIAIQKIINVAGGNLNKVKIGLLGLSFKPNTDDIRESPALYIAKRLIEEGAILRVFDPAAMENAKEVLGSSCEYCNDSYEVAKDAEIVVVATEWNQFRNLDLKKIHSLMRGSTIVDLRNVYEPEKVKSLGMSYIGMGRR